MLHPTTKIQWLDAKTEKVYKEEVSKIFQIYSHRAEMTSDVLEVMFNVSDLIKITDMYGWTEVRGIRKIVNVNGWMGLGVANQQIKLSRNTVIPIYEPNAPYQGFHGETKYPFTAKMLSDIQDGDMVRVRRGVNENGEDVEFATVLFSGDLHVGGGEPNYGYEIITKSGFYNANNIHLLDKA